MKIYLPIQKKHLGCDHLMFPKCCAFPLDNGHQFKQVITQGNVTTPKNHEVIDHVIKRFLEKAGQSVPRG